VERGTKGSKGDSKGSKGIQRGSKGKCAMYICNQFVCKRITERLNDDIIVYIWQ
jgi:hypothetical protein